jgi:TRAP-type mannitol/chloroaromatic compound transport system substrate-binding protein
MRTNISRMIAALGLVGPVTLAGITDGGAQERVRWKMQSSFGGQMSVVGEGGPRFAENIDRMTGGGFDIEFYEPGALVPALEVFDAVSKGSIEAAWTSAGYHVAKIPSLAFFTAVPFGPAAGEYLAWLHYGGGLDIYREVYDQHNIVGMPCNILAPEASGWFQDEIMSTEDLKGMKMRFFGLGAKVMQKMGVSTQLLAPGDIFPALERGVIDATELATPSIDLGLGLHEVAKHYYFPGWHQQTTVLELLVNKDQWNELPDPYRAIVEVACGDGVNWGFVRSEAVQFPALQELKDQGVVIHRWSDATLDALEAAWMEVVAEESANDPLFKRTWDSYSAFRENYKIWKDHGYLE